MEGQPLCPCSSKGRSTQQDTPTTGSTQQDTPTTGSTQQDTPTTGSTQQDTPTTGSTQQDTPTTGSTQQDTPTTGSTQQDTPTTGSTQQDTPTTGSTQQDTPTTGSTQQDTPTTSSTQQDTPTTGSTQQDTPTTGSTQQDTPTTGSTQQDTPTTGSTQQDTPTTGSTQQDTPTTGSTQQDTPTTSSSQPGTATTSSTQPGTATTSSTQPGTATTSSSQPGTATTSSTQQDTTTTTSCQGDKGADCKEAMRRILCFISMPKSCYWISLVWQIAFLTLYSYVLLFDLRDTPSPAFIVLIVWVSDTACEEIRQLLTSSLKVRGKKDGLVTRLKTYWSQKWNKLDVASVAGFVLGVILVMVPSHYVKVAGRWVLAVDVFVFFLRFLQILMVFRELGLLLVMAERMVRPTVYCVLCTCVCSSEKQLITNMANLTIQYTLLEL
ncbi:TRIO and F-actin-binding protein-like [Littorina saxatilis]|uniref:TRIO and F-actin-binding protein-like n=1 Tax=Littorina saxatilis TaxID=31220 RepID=UPI0038B4CBB7